MSASLDTSLKLAGMDLSEPGGAAAADRLPVSPQLKPVLVRGRPRLGEKLIALGLLRQDQLDLALEDQRLMPGRKLGARLVERDFICEAALDAVLGTADAAADPQLTLIDPSAVRLLPRDIAEAGPMLVTTASAGTVVLAVPGAVDVDAVTALRPYFPSAARIEPRLWPRETLVATIAAVHRHDMTLAGTLGELRASDGTSERQGGWADPAVRAVNAVLLEAIRLGASEIQFEPGARQVRIVLRVDGALHPLEALPGQHYPAVLARLDALAQGAPDAGGTRALSFVLGARRFAARLARFATRHGDLAALSLVEASREAPAFERLQLSDRPRARLTRAMTRPQGLILAAGPRMSGRSTTLASILNACLAPELSAVAIEARPEFALPAVRQARLDDTPGARARAIRAALKQNPDLILLDEIEDGETAQAALAAAMAGSRVLSAIYATDALSALYRLRDLGVSPSLFHGGISAVISQRLVRKLCPVCKESRPATAQECALIGADPNDPPHLSHPTGCPYCRGFGHRGRLIVSEVLVLDGELDDMIERGAPRAALAEKAAARGFRPIAADAVQRVRAGEIAPEELSRVVDMSRL